MYTVVVPALLFLYYYFIINWLMIFLMLMGHVLVRDVLCARPFVVLDVYRVKLGQLISFIKYHTMITTHSSTLLDCIAGWLVLIISVRLSVWKLLFASQLQTVLLCWLCIRSSPNDLVCMFFLSAVCTLEFVFLCFCLMYVVKFAK